MRKIGVFLLLSIGYFLWGEAVSLKAYRLRLQNMEHLIFLEVPLKNFGTDELKSMYQEAKENYSKALAFYFEKRFLKAYRKFVEVHKQVEKILELLSLSYLERTQEMLQEVGNRLVDIVIEYDKNSGKVRRIRKNREAPKEKPLYDPKEVHLYYDRDHIARTVENGYAFLGEAHRVRQKAFIFEKFLEEHQKLNDRMREERIQAFKISIRLCREAKKNAIQAFQLLNKNDIYTVQIQYKDNPYMKEYKLDPVFDPRIPDKYKVDANDALNRIHEDEVRYKIRLEAYKEKKEEEKAPSPQRQD